MVSTAGLENPIHLKEKIWKGSTARLGIKSDELADQPLRIVEELGDPMQASVLGFISGLAPETEIILAGGTQMIAVAALLSKLDPSRKPLIATTKYVACDKSSSFCDMAKSLGLETYIAPLDFSDSPHAGLRDYERGYVKEGVGAGGSILYADKLGVPVSAVIERTNSIYATVSSKATA
jgi:NaMN:DMB phosphoribosyltransferase